MRYKYLTALTAFILMIVSGCGGSGGSNVAGASASLTSPPICPNGTVKTPTAQTPSNLLCDVPTLSSISPANNASDVSVDAFAGVVVITDSPLDIKSLTTDNIKLTLSGANVSGVVTAVGMNGLRFTTSTKLNYGQQYTFTASVKDLLGKSFIQIINFSTKPIVCNTPLSVINNGNACGIPLFKTSYENKNSINFDETQIPDVRALGIPKYDQYEQGTIERSITFADFFREGKYSAFVTSSVAKNLYGDINLADSPAVIYFLRSDGKGGWKDETDKLIDNKSDRYSCIWPTYSIVADFNNDGFPDVFISCTGADRWWNTYEENMERCCSNQILYLSQLNGKYIKKEIPDYIYGHKAAAGDINGDGCIDIISSNAAFFSDGLPIVYLGKCDGTFHRETNFLPTNIRDFTGGFGLFAVDLIPINGRLDLFIGGGRGEQQQGLVWLKGSKTGVFYEPIDIKLPTSKNLTVNNEYQFPLDIIYDGTSLYLLTSLTSDVVTEWVILRTLLSDLVNIDTIFTHMRTGVLGSPSMPDGEIGHGVAQMKSTKDGYLVAYSGACRFSPSTNLGMCAMKVKR